MTQRFITFGGGTYEGWHMEEWRKLIIITIVFAILFAQKLGTNYVEIMATTWKYFQRAWNLR